MPNLEVATSIRNFASSQLRTAYPSMNTTARDGYLDAIFTGTKTVIEQQQQQQTPIKSSPPEPPKLTFLDRPTTIRFRIYRLALTSGPFSDISSPLLIHGDVERLMETDFVLPSILHTSQQVRQEASRVHYGRNRFVVELGQDFIDADDFEMPEVLKWLEVLGEETVKLIKDLEFRIKVGRDVDRAAFARELCDRAKASPGALNLEKPVEEWNQDVFLNALPWWRWGFR